MTEQFYRDFLLPTLVEALAENPSGCGEANLDPRSKFRVRGVSKYDPQNFYPEPIPEQAMAPLAGADRVLRVDVGNAAEQDFARFWLVVEASDRYYLFHPVLFQIASCFDEKFALVADAPKWCESTSSRG